MRRIALIALGVMLLGAAGASAASPPSPDLRQTLIATAGADDSCAQALVSDLGGSWATVSNEPCLGDTRTLLVNPGTGWIVRTTVPISNLSRCPLQAVPGNVGFELGVCTLTPPLGVWLVSRDLASRYGTRYTTSPRRWIACPANWIAPTAFSALGRCQFEFRVGSAAYAGSLTLRPQARGFVTDLAARGFGKVLRACPLAAPRTSGALRIANRRLWKTGFFAACSPLRADGGIAKDVEAAALRRFPAALGALTVRLHGHNWAGYTARAVFRCTSTRSGATTTATCRNTLGDAIRTSFQITRRTTTTPPPPTGGIPLQPDLPGDQNCDDFPGPVRVLPGDPDNLDNDGDGIGCDAN